MVFIEFTQFTQFFIRFCSLVIELLLLIYLLHFLQCQFPIEKLRTSFELIIMGQINRKHHYKFYFNYLTYTEIKNWIEADPHKFKEFQPFYPFYYFNG